MATARKAPGKPSLDDESKAAIYNGMNLSQLCALFKMDNRTVLGKIQAGGVKPSGTRNQTDIYYVHEVAPYLVKPAYDIEAYIKRMHHSELPKHLTKEFWAGLKSKQDYEERAGMLWRTEKVVQEVGELFKLVKMSALLMVDAVERTTELSERQRDIIKGLTHGMLDEIRGRVEENFRVPEDKPSRIDDEFEPQREVKNERQEAEDDEEL